MATDTSATTTLPSNIQSPVLTDAERADLAANPKTLDAPIDPTTGQIDYSVPVKEAGLYIPPKGVYFRLVNYQNSYVLFSRSSPEPQVGDVYINDVSVSDEQFFTLEPGSGDHNGLFVIRAKGDGRVLYCRMVGNPWVGHFDTPDEECWFEILPGTGQYAGTFKLMTPASYQLCIVPGGGGIPNNFPSYYPDTGDMFWGYLFEDMEVVSVTYDLDQGKIANQTPETLATGELDNTASSTDQDMSFEVSESTAQTSDFEYSSGFTLEVGTEFSAGIPEVADVSTSMTVGTTQTWTFGESEQTSKTYTATFSIHAKAGTAVRAIATVSKGTLDVPYTITLKSKSTGVQTQTHGIWKGVSSWDLRCTTSDI